MVIDWIVLGVLGFIYYCEAEKAVKIVRREKWKRERLVRYSR